MAKGTKTFYWSILGLSTECVNCDINYVKNVFVMVTQSWAQAKNKQTEKTENIA